MPVTVVTRKSSETQKQAALDLVKQIPGACFLEIKQLTPDSCNTKTCLQGSIHSLWDIQQRKSGCHRKLIIKDSDECSINVFLYGEYADGTKNAKKGDTLLLNNFEVEESVHLSTCKHKYQVTVHENHKPNVWLIPEDKEDMNPGRTTTGTSKTKKYKYTNLADIKSGTMVDIFGVVKFLKPPKQTRGTDVMLIVSLIDPTLHEFDQKLTCVLFLKAHKVPKIEVGNVVRFHRLKIITHQGRMQGGTSAGFSWLVFSSADSDPEASTPNYTYSPEHQEKVRELFEWSKSQSVPVSDDTCCLSDIAVNVYFNLVCQVVSTCMIEDGVCFLLRVWDGTRPVYPVRDLDTNRDECLVQTDRELQGRAEGYMYDVCVFDDHVNTARRVTPGMFIKLYNLHAAAYKNSETNEDLSALPTVELVLHRGTTYGRGMLFLDSQSQDVKELKTKLDSVVPIPQPGQSTNKNEGKQTSKKRRESGSSVEIYSEESNDVVMVEDGPQAQTKNKKHGEENVPSKKNRCHLESRQGEGHVTEVSQFDEMEIMSSEEPRCMQETATVILDHPHVKRTKISDVLEHIVPYKFRVKARVWDYHPLVTTSTDFVHIYCYNCHFLCKFSEYELNHIERLTSSGNRLCPLCQDDQPLELTYMLQLLLHDGTAGLPVKLWRKEADKFFKDITAKEVISDPRSFSEVKVIMNSVCPAGADIAQKPWVECCVMSYSNGGDVNYQMFDTVVA